MKESTFRIRPYSKRELAMLYFPYMRNVESAVKKLRQTMTYCYPLMKELEKTRYVTRSHYFTARQVELIVEFIGEP